MDSPEEIKNNNVSPHPEFKKEVKRDFRIAIIIVLITWFIVLMTGPINLQIIIYSLIGAIVGIISIYVFIYWVYSLKWRKKLSKGRN